MIIDCISDLHGFKPTLDGGDLLIVAGDLTSNGSFASWIPFVDWLNNQKYEKIIFIPGNHDNMLQIWDQQQENEGYTGPVSDPEDRIEYLCDSGTKFEGLKIWGSPWTNTFPGMNPRCKAFTVDTEEELQEKWNLIPNDIDILITHSPPYGILDSVKTGDEKMSDPPIPVLRYCGSGDLFNRVTNKIKPKLHVFGHIHEHGGKSMNIISTIYVNASIVNERYSPINKPVRIIL